MRSEHVDEFNHDDVADGYDDDVLDESNPIRAGYRATLEWAIQVGRFSDEARVLELGSGTGKLTELIPAYHDLVCVDASNKMEKLAEKRLGDWPNRTFLQDDVLGVFERDLGKFDAIVSTYTLHHLTDDEKKVFFREVWGSLTDGGRAVFGDLMLESRGCERDKILEYQKIGDDNTAGSIEEEFFWYVDEAQEALEEIGFQVTVERFSDLSFGILAVKQRG